MHVPGLGALVGVLTVFGFLLSANCHITALMVSFGRIFGRSIEQVRFHLIFFTIYLACLSKQHGQNYALYCLLFCLRYKGAATTCYVAMHPQVKAISGKFFDNCSIAKPSSKASDAELAKKLWQFSLQTVSSWSSTPLCPVTKYT
jgi:heme/copper-type cytochrome/quinol oxidase subunit 4